MFNNTMSKMFHANGCMSGICRSQWLFNNAGIGALVEQQSVRLKCVVFCLGSRSHLGIVCIRSVHLKLLDAHSRCASADYFFPWMYSHIRNIDVLFLRNGLLCVLWDRPQSWWSTNRIHNIVLRIHRPNPMLHLVSSCEQRFDSNYKVQRLFHDHSWPSFCE